MKIKFYKISISIILIAVGLLIWLSNLSVLNIAWRRDWPVILILVGMIELIKVIIKRA